MAKVKMSDAQKAALLEQKLWDKWAARGADLAAGLDAAHAEAIAEDVDRTHDRWNWLVRGLQMSVERYAGSLSEWGAKFAVRPCGALEWGHDAFRHAARQHVAKETLVSLNNWGPVRTVSYLRKQVRDGALYPPMSSSATSNLMAVLKTAAYAEMVEESAFWPGVK